MANEITKVTDQNGVDHPFKDVAAFPRSEQAVLGAKNLALANRATTQTISSMDFTVDSSDVNVVTVNGINSAEAWFNYMDIELPEGNYIGSGCTNGSDTTYMLSFVIRNAGNTGDEATIKCFNGDVNITVPSGGRHVRAFIVVRNGKTLTNQLFKLMIRLATDPDDTYAPYAMTNKELTDKVVKSKQILITIDPSISINANTEGEIFNGYSLETAIPDLNEILSFEFMWANGSRAIPVAQEITGKKTIYLKVYAINDAVTISSVRLVVIYR